MNSTSSSTSLNVGPLLECDLLMIEGLQCRCLNLGFRACSYTSRWDPIVLGVSGSLAMLILIVTGVGDKG